MATDQIRPMDYDCGPGEQYLFREATGFDPVGGADWRVPQQPGSPAGDGQSTGVNLSVGALPSGSYRKSDMFDLGEPRNREFAIDVVVRLAATPTANQVCTVWIAEGPNGISFGGGIAAGDAAYTPAAGALGQITRIGSVPVIATTNLNAGRAGIWVPKYRYGVLVFLNESGTAIQTPTEFHVVATPIVEEGVTISRS